MRGKAEIPIMKGFESGYVVEPRQPDSAPKETPTEDQGWETYNEKCASGVVVKDYGLTKHNVSEAYGAMQDAVDLSTTVEKCGSGKKKIMFKETAEEEEKRKKDEDEESFSESGPEEEKGVGTKVRGAIDKVGRTVGGAVERLGGGKRRSKDILEARRAWLRKDMDTARNKYTSDLNEVLRDVNRFKSKAKELDDSMIVEKGAKPIIRQIGGRLGGSIPKTGRRAAKAKPGLRESMEVPSANATMGRYKPGSKKKEELLYNPWSQAKELDDSMIVEKGVGSFAKVGKVGRYGGRSTKMSRTAWKKPSDTAKSTSMGRSRKKPVPKSRTWKDKAKEYGKMAGAVGAIGGIGYAGGTGIAAGMGAIDAPKGKKARGAKAAAKQFATKPWSNNIDLWKAARSGKTGPTEIGKSLQRRVERYKKNRDKK